MAHRSTGEAPVMRALGEDKCFNCRCARRAGDEARVARAAAAHNAPPVPPNPIVKLAQTATRQLVQKSRFSSKGLSSERACCCVPFCQAPPRSAGAAACTVDAARERPARRCAARSETKSFARRQHNALSPEHITQRYTTCFSTDLTGRWIDALAPKAVAERASKAHQHRGARRWWRDSWRGAGAWPAA